MIIYFHDLLAVVKLYVVLLLNVCPIAFDRPEKKRRFRERAPWERENFNDEYDSCSDAEFDESAFLHNRLPSAIRQSTSIERELNSGALFKKNSKSLYFMLWL
mgnify:CR=1 FL=1